ncbi:class I SAM-dependent methyltransferase [Trueperella pecoris]|uniref:Class I SAM-dependent methyltransferase n=1 Tax=Trueperella pecoris TaxID=2733571 RepID=A0A7M1R591_9ACTO|nr:class I SAM-dependent methyltransferase [Trueperella pecoris]QOR48645.1 class I SAM-dependent methyltransferase [Trueperella pecoris]
MSAGFMPLQPHDDDGSANAQWWTDNSDEYLAEHGEVLGEADFVWGPEGLREEEAQVLGSPSCLQGLRILEIGSGAAQCSRYLAGLGLDVTACDISPGMIAAAARLNADAHLTFPLAVADARRLPYENGSFDVVFTSFGAIDFIEDLAELHREVRRVLAPGGRWVFSASHPVKWVFADDANSFRVKRSYWDRTPYVERNESGDLEYVNFHHTLADHVNALAECGFTIEEMIEPTWPAGRTTVWGAWGPVRSSRIPGTVIFATRAR